MELGKAHNSARERVAESKKILFLLYSSMLHIYFLYKENYD
ncbi:hypothetical protein XBKQ1_960020 [Xenorhabdus bovienii str. kraussei Quebec]|uniref:Uncharacterized protein n=2 Tax=Xenorhabdus bovienii TaxID=40576 RepID=A0A077PM07_XENBV|nr:hypothetical protein XBKQ1_960020 [Xenorhabdus bovienii str. kraussei Quebec]CDM92147.1 protein of unknown function [Xenorhabdus bovienii]